MEHAKTHDNLYKIRHSFAHILAIAALDKYPEAKLAIGPAIDTGFYYDIDFGDEKVTEDDLKDLQKRMKKIAGRGLEFSGKEVSAAEALEHYKDNPYKSELIKEFSTEGKTITLYNTGDTFIDLCAGGHVENTSELPLDAFKLSSVAGAYWRGDEKNKMLTRIYGIAFETKEDLDAHMTMLAEAKKRDHRKIAKELDIFMISDEVGKGLPLWLPNGAFIYKKLQDYMYEKERLAGFKHVNTPVITKKGLYEKSGHLAHYQEDMYNPMDIEGEDFYLRPMNCPHHHQIFNHKPLSYKDLPLRLAEFGDVFRFERSGNLTGIIRARSFCQNDSHIYAAKSQLKEELRSVLHMFKEVYADFSIDDYWFRLSLPDEDNKEKYGYLDDKEMWEESAQVAREVLNEENAEYTEEKGEAAFYGPKIDVQIKNVFGNEDTIATIQIDFYSAKKFNLEFTNSDGEKEPVVIIHRAIMGSFERFLAFMLESTAGNLPLWIVPTQVAIIPIAEPHNEYAEGIYSQLKEAGYRVSIDTSNNGFGKKVRAAKKEMLPYFIVIGDQDMEAKKVTLESRDTGESEQLHIDEVLLKLNALNNF
jgi:threonyl-tRNA synthetase